MLPVSLNSRHRPFFVRGVIEGFYGRPFTWEERAGLVRFIGEHGMNRYVYAPKNDPLHRERWREPYAPDELGAFRALADAGERAGVALVYALAPGLTYDVSEPSDFEHLEAKLAALLDCGVRGIALLFDDITPDSTAVDPLVQADLVARVAARVAARNRDAEFWFIGNFYTGTADDLRSDRGFFATLYPRRALDYFAAYAERVPPQIPMMWTGPGVFSARIEASDAAALRDLVGRPLILWDNFPVNDALPNHLFLGPYRGREPGLSESMLGVVVNLMGQPAANRLPLATAASFLRAPQEYDPDRAFGEALAQFGDAGSGALAMLAEHHRGHPVLASDCAADGFAADIRAAFPAGGSDPAAIARLRDQLQTIAANDHRLRAELRDEELLRDVAPWSAKLAALAEASLAGLRAIDGVSEIDEYRRQRDAALALPQVVCSTILPSPLAPFCVGGGEGVDRFAELFSAIDRALG
jgi:hyaluronoglucosaminidase